MPTDTNTTTTTILTCKELSAVLDDPTLYDRVIDELRHFGDLCEETRRLVRLAVGTPPLGPRREPDDDALWAHRDQGTVAYLIAGNMKLLLVADLDTERPLFVFDVPASDPGHFMERMVTEYRLHELHMYRHRRPQRVHARAMACADQQLERLMERGRGEGQNVIEVPDDMIWVWLPDDDEKAMIDGSAMNRP